jgi:hypothetical protein
MIQHFNNVLPRFYLQDLQDKIFNSDITWVHHNETAGGYNGNYSWIDDDNTEETDMFSYKQPRESSERLFSYDVLYYTVSELLGFKLELERIKLNLMLPKQKTKLNGYNRPHIDYPEAGMKTFLLYLNDADGDTFIFDKIYNGEDPGEMKVIERVTPRENTAILFDSNRYHASSITTFGKRSVINVVFWEPGVKQKYWQEQQDKMQVPFEPIPQSFSGVNHIRSFFQKK